MQHADAVVARREDSAHKVRAAALIALSMIEPAARIRTNSYVRRHVLVPTVDFGSQKLQHLHLFNGVVVLVLSSLNQLSEHNRLHYTTPRTDA